MKILMVTEIYLPIWGGAENQLRQLIPHLSKHGIDVSVVTRRWYKDWAVEDVIDGVKVSRVGIPGRGVFATFVFVLSLVHYIFANKAQIDILHSHGGVNMGAICSIMAMFLKKRNVAKIATAGKVEPLRNSFLGTIVLGFFKRSGAIISMTSEIDRELSSIDTREDIIHRITNGVDVNRFHPAGSDFRRKWREKNGLESKARIVLFSGRFVHRKGLDILLDAWPSVITAYPDTQLLIVGSGDDQADSTEEDMRKLVIDGSLSNVLFHGATDCPELLLRVADLFVFPSRKEGFPNALMEALATGLPVLASNIGGVTSLIENGKTGFIFASGDSAALARKLIDALGNIEECRSVGTMARINMIKNYSFDKTSRKYVSLYRSLLNLPDELPQQPLISKNGN